MNRKIFIYNSWNIKNKIFVYDNQIMLFLYPMGSVSEVSISKLTKYLKEISIRISSNEIFRGKITIKNNNLKSLLISDSQKIGFVYNTITDCITYYNKISIS